MKVENKTYEAKIYESASSLLTRFVQVEATCLSEAHKLAAEKCKGDEILAGVYEAS